MKHNALRSVPQLVVMLTHDDLTVMNAAEIFEQCSDSKAQCWGIKEHPLPLADMKTLFGRMKECGKTTFLEVVAYTEAEGLRGAEMAVECGCDILMGTMYADCINDYCRAHSLRYMPFVGKITGRPSVLEGSIDDIIAEARQCLAKGVYGFDLLGYRYTGDAVALNKAFVEAINAPVCLAGSVNSRKRLSEVVDASPWAFTIGSAFFERQFGDSFREQIDEVCDFLVSAANGEAPNEVVDYYETIADSYDESRFANSYGLFIDAEERRILDRLIDTSQPTRRLEMACGTGRLTNYATHGLDASPNMMQLARRRHPSVEYRHASAADTGYPDESFDLVYAFHLLMHLDHATIGQILHEAHRILKPGGRLIIDLPSRKRRELLRHRQASWHGGTQLASDDVVAMASHLFRVRSSHGIMMLPIHKLPNGLRRRLVGLDYRMANGWLKEYSSYLVYELVKSDH